MLSGKDDMQSDENTKSYLKLLDLFSMQSENMVSSRCTAIPLAIGTVVLILFPDYQREVFAFVLGGFTVALSLLFRRLFLNRQAQELEGELRRKNPKMDAELSELDREFKVDRFRR